MDLSDGPAFECWPGSHQDEIFVELQKTEGEVQRVMLGMRIRMVSHFLPFLHLRTLDAAPDSSLHSAVVRWHPPGLCDSPNGSFRVLQDAGRGWLQGKGMKRQRVPISAWPAPWILDLMFNMNLVDLIAPCCILHPMNKVNGAG